jgi:hypothetical protein
MCQFSREYPAREMARNPVRTIPVELALNTQTVWYLDRLIESGLFGNSHAEAAKIAVFDHCKLLIAQGKLREAPAVLGSTAIIVNDGAKEIPEA